MRKGMQIIECSWGSVCREILGKAYLMREEDFRIEQTLAVSKLKLGIKFEQLPCALKLGELHEDRGTMSAKNLNEDPTLD